MKRRRKTYTEVEKLVDKCIEEAVVKSQRLTEYQRVGEVISVLWDSIQWLEKKHSRMEEETFDECPF